MQFRGHSQKQFAGRRFIRVNALFLAVRQIVFDCKLELGPQLPHGFAMETDDVANAENPAAMAITVRSVLEMAYTGDGLRKGQAHQTNFTEMEPSGP